MDFVRLMALAGHRAFKVGDEARPLGRQIVVVLHRVTPTQCLRALNTTKWDSEKLTTKLIAIDISFAASTGMT